MLKTKDDLKSLINSFNEATLYWKDNLNKSVNSSNVDNPINELIKLISLIKAHTTKVGIIFKPENVEKDPSAAYNTLEKLSQTLVLLISVIGQLKQKELSKIYYSEIINQSKSLIVANYEFSSELSLDGRLISVGKIWNICDSLTSLLENNNLGFLSFKINQTLSILDDGWDEFVSWCDDPIGQEDPFEISEEDEDDDYEYMEISELKEYVNYWLNKIKLVKLLISSFKKSLPKSTTGDEIDQIYNLQSGIINLIDSFIMDIMLIRNTDLEIDKCTNQITINSIKLAKLASSIHKDTKKSQWYISWITKYDNSD
ncbi:unnamed protein product [Candida verbasci]|uniref:Cyclin-D1-binding protein 1-like N-terminal domain-containing protein n=1 Tax=Candida verbasci TaxID=1227364 RepID=A0A9W4TRT0_9ASCO|nr:unnamed protein product [Candida verbasci]